MLQSVGTLLGFCSTGFWLAKVTVAPLAEMVNTPEQASLFFSGPQFFIALIAGVIMAFAFQFLLTNFTVAAGISSGDGSLDADSVESLNVDSDDSWSYAVRKLESKVGAWTLLIVSIAIFIACFLAVKLTLISSPALGAIVGVVIWSAYFLLLLWVSSTAVGSLVGSVVNMASLGMQGVMGTAGASLAGRTANTQIVNTVETSVAAVRRELSSAIDPTRVRETLQDYLADLPVPKLDLKQIRSDFANLLSSSDLRSLADGGVLQNVNRQTFVDLISSRIADQLESAWQRVIGVQQPTNPKEQLLNFLQSASPEELTSNQLSDKLGQLVGVGRAEGGNASDGNDNGLMEQALELGVSALVGRVVSRTDLSDIDVQKISHQLQQFKDQATEQAKSLSSKVADRLPGQSFNPIQADVENYLLNSKPWHLNRETIKQEFKDVIYDPEAAPKAVRQQLERLNRDNFVKVLESRGLFTSDRIADIADQLEEIRKEVFDTVQIAESEEQSQDLRSRVENYLRSTGKEELNPEGIEQNFKALLNDPEAGIEVLSHRLSQFDRDTLVSLLSQRQDISEEEANQIVDNIASVRNQLVEQAQAVQHRMQSVIDNTFGKIRNYLNSLDRPELNYEGIKQDLRKVFDKVFDDPEAGFEALRDRLGQFDRETLVAVLSSREDISEADANRIIDQIEGVRDSVLHRAERLQEEAQKRVKELKHKAKEQMAETRKAAATAAWWLFGTAITSVAVAAFAGVLAVGGLAIFD